jgi:general secretion pathway protein H
MRSFRLRAQRGFTLIELLVVFALVALLVGAAPLAFERLRESAQYRNTVRGLISDMRQARQKAIADGTEVRFHLDLPGRTFGIDGRPSHEVPQPLQLRATVAAIEFSKEQVAAIRFLPQGGATGGSVEVLRPSGAGIRLTVDWLSGAVTQSAIQP